MILRRSEFKSPARSAGLKARITVSVVRAFRETLVAERLLTLEEVCRKLGGVKPWTVRMWVSQRRIPYTKVGRLTRFPETRIDRWIVENTVAPR